MRKRSKLEISFDVLKAISVGETKPTRIMYRANLSWSSLQKVIKSLHGQGFIDVQNLKNSKRYNITAKGQGALRYYLNATKDLIEVEQTI